MSKQQTLSGLDVVHHRPINFNFSPDEAPKYWFDNDPWLTHLFNALFFAVPDGERWVMESARKQLPLITDQKQQHIVRQFIRQEASHSKEHDSVNALMARYGLPAASIESNFQRIREKIQGYFGANVQAGVAAAIEHFTAVLSEVLLEHPELFENMHPKMRALIYWHMVEETEHKGVSFDIFNTTVGNDVRAYMIRIACLLGTFGLGFFAVVYGGQFYLLYSDKQLFNTKSALHCAKTLFVKPAVMRKIWRRSLAFFRPDFHPWQHNNLALISLWCEEYARSKDPVQATELLFQWQQLHLHDYLKNGYGSPIQTSTSSTTATTISC